LKIVVFGPRRRTGVLLGEEVVDISLAAAKRLAERDGEPDPLRMADALAPSGLGRFIEGGARALETVEAALEHLGNAADRDGPGGAPIVFAAAEVTLHAPRADRARVACAGGNFADHSQAMAERRAERGEGDEEIGDARERVRKRGFWGFWKVDRESVGHEGKVIYPRRAIRLDYEGELAVVIGKRGKDIRAEDFAEHIWGVTLLGDWSIRLAPEKGPMVFGMQKNFDTSTSIGPCIVTGGSELLDAEIETLVNGERRQHFNAADMVFSYGEYAEYLSRDFTFHPGDMIGGGTGAGTAADSSPTLEDGRPGPDRFLKPGDTVEIRSPAIGTLRSHIVAAEG
jgi:2-keto-4-pentenoate hydratase/2-oxohepta-3-ene-1,7-dioic acid hydratase in catechol pathway